MTTRKTIQKMIGNPFHNSPAGLMKDTDGDGVVNGLDCEPLNPKKQGLSHRLARKAARFIPGKELRRETMESISAREASSIATKKAAREERQTQAVKTAVEREKLRGERQRKFAQGGGIGGSIGRGFSNFAKNIPAGTQIANTRSKGRKKRAKTTLKRKKGKSKTRIVYVQRKEKKPTERKPFDMNSLKFDF